MPLVEVRLLQGRSAEQKERLALEIIRAFSTVLGTPSQHMTVIFQDSESHDWHVGAARQEDAG